MESGALIYVMVIVTYGAAMLTLLAEEAAAGVGPWLTGILSIVSLVLFGFYAQKISIQAVRAAGLVLMEAQAGFSPDHGQAVTEKWNSPDRHGGTGRHKRFIGLSYALALVLALIIVGLPLYRLAQMGAWVQLAIFGSVSAFVLQVHVLAWLKIRHHVGVVLEQASERRAVSRGELVSIGAPQAVDCRAFYLAEREDASAMESGSLTHVVIIITYGIAMLTLLSGECVLQVDVWIIGVLTFVSLVLFGLYAQKVALQGIRAAGAVLLESESGLDARYGQSVVESWNSVGSCNASRVHRVPLACGYIRTNSRAGIRGHLPSNLPAFPTIRVVTGSRIFTGRRRRAPYTSSRTARY